MSDSSTFISQKFQLSRYEGNPILSPKEDSPWESLVSTNPAAWRDEDSGKIQLIYRAAGNDEEHRVHLGLAESENGYDFKRVSAEPILSPLIESIDNGCVEDPRVIKIGDWFYVTSATRPFPPGRYWREDANQADRGSEFPQELPIALKEKNNSTHMLLT
ncbi:MAG: glycosidase, partial [Verrucomicrobiota bacterium]